MIDDYEETAKVVAQLLCRRRPKERSGFLRDLLYHGAAALAVIDGDRPAAEHVYRLADNIVDTAKDKP